MTPETKKLLLSACRENRLAALHIDLQYDFASINDFSDIVDRTARMANVLRKTSVPNIWLAYTNPHGKLVDYRPVMTVKTFNLAAKKSENWGDAVVRNTRAANRETLIVKNTSDAFEKSALERHLQENKIDTLLVTGVHALCCVEKTLHSGLLRENMNFIIVGDCTNIPNDILNYRSYILGGIIGGRRHPSETAEQRLHLTSSIHISETIEGVKAPLDADCNSPSLGL